MDAHNLQSEMDALFSTFLPTELASRFSRLLAMKPAHWLKIDPGKVWGLVDARRITDWSAPVGEILESPLFAKHANELVAVLRCGHDDAELHRIRLQDALLGPSAVFEGFVSIVPGRLGIAINHDGMLCTLKR
jgi:hypothetical protein